jgi:hypothetical protein
MPTTELIAVTTAFLCLLVGFVVLVRFFRAWLLHRTLRKAIERDSGAAPALIERIGALEDGRNQLGNDDRNGMVLIAFGLALVGFAMIGLGNRPDEMRVVASAALFPLFVGVALLVRRKLLKRELAAEAEAERGA